MAKCRSCGVTIRFIKILKTGNKIPVNPYVTRIVTEHGEVIDGFEPHMNTCPKANKDRRNGIGGEV